MASESEYSKFTPRENKRKAPLQPHVDLDAMRAPPTFWDRIMSQPLVPGCT